MPKDKADASWLWDMLDAAKAIREFVSNRSFEDYLDDRMLRGAVERHLEIIGEAAGRISKDLQKTHSVLPWKKIMAQRHVLAHEYGDLEHRLIWNVATIHINQLIDELEKIIPPSPQGTV